MHFDKDIGAAPIMAQRPQMAQFQEFLMLKIVFSTQFCMEKATTSDDLRKMVACLGTLVSISTLNEYIWRHRGDFQISTFYTYKQPQNCGDGKSGNWSSRWKFKNPLGGAICILISNQMIPNMGISLYYGWLQVGGLQMALLIL